MERIRSCAHIDARRVPTSMEGATTCAICMEDVTPEDCHSLECNHTFHPGCLITWLRRGNLSCPCCRGDLTQEEENKIPSYLLNQRASYLRRMARRRTAPAPLIHQVEAVRKAERDSRDRSKEYSEYLRANRQVYKVGRALLTRKHASRRRTRHLLRLLGLFHSFEFPLPPLRLNR